MDKLKKLEEENKKLRKTLKEIHGVLSKEEPEKAVEKSKKLIILANL